MMDSLETLSARPMPQDGQRLLALLVKRGWIPSGGATSLLMAAHLMHWTIDRTDIAIRELHRKGWLDVFPESALEDINYLLAVRENDTKVKLQVRVSDDGIMAWKNEIAVRIQTKQFDDMDGAIRRSWISIGIAVAAAVAALLKLLLD